MSRNFLALSLFSLLLVSLVACESWDAEYPFKLGFTELHRGRDTFMGMDNRNVGLSIVPDENITIYGLRVEGHYIKDVPFRIAAYSRRKGDWAWQPERFMPAKNRTEGGMKAYPQQIAKGEEAVLNSWDENVINYERMKIYTDKGTWLINIDHSDKNLFKAKKSNDKFDKEKNESYKVSIMDD